MRSSRCETDAEIPILSIMSRGHLVLKQVRRWRHCAPPSLTAASAASAARRREPHNTFEQNSNGPALTSDCNLAWHRKRRSGKERCTLVCFNEISSGTKVFSKNSLRILNGFGILLQSACLILYCNLAWHRKRRSKNKHCTLVCFNEISSGTKIFSKNYLRILNGFVILLQSACLNFILQLGLTIWHH